MKNILFSLVLLATVAASLATKDDIFVSGLNLNDEPSQTKPLMKALLPNEHSQPKRFEPEITRTICPCESKKSEKCAKKTTMMTPTMSTTTMRSAVEKEEVSTTELKEIMEKLETLLHKKVFKSIVKRSVDASGSTNSMMKMFDSMKKMFDLTETGDVKQFKEKLMSIPEGAKVPLAALIQHMKPHDNSQEATMFATSSSTVQVIGEQQSECDQKSQIECGMGRKLKIIKGVITNKNRHACPTTSTMSTNGGDDDSHDTTCTEQVLTTKYLNQTCTGKASCTISVDRDFENMCECAEGKYLELTYTCVDDGSVRHKRSIHYRNRPNQIDRDRALRNVAGFGGGLYGGFGAGLYGGFGYGGFGGYGLGPLAYGGFGGYGLGPLAYGGFGGYGLGPLDYYYGYGYPFVNAITYDY